MNEENWGNNGKGRSGVALVQPDQNMMAPQMRNSYEFRLVQVPSYFGRAVGVTYFCHKHDFVTNFMWAFH